MISSLGATTGSRPERMRRQPRTPVVGLLAQHQIGGVWLDQEASRLDLDTEDHPHIRETVR